MNSIKPGTKTEITLVGISDNLLEKVTLKRLMKLNFLLYRGRLFIRVGDTDTFKQQPYLEIY